MSMPFTLWATILLPSSPQAGYQTTRDSCCAPEPTKIIQLTNPKPRLFLPAETTIKILATFPLLPVPPEWPLRFLACSCPQHGVTPPLGTLSTMNCLFDGSCLLLCWFHHISLTLKPEVPQERENSSPVGLWIIRISLVPPKLSLSWSWLAWTLNGQLLKVLA